MTTNGTTPSFFLKHVLQIFSRPRNLFDWVSSETGRLWGSPLLVLMFVTLARVLLNGWYQSRLVMAGEIPLPPDWMYYTPEMQTQYIQAAQATQSPIFLYVLPAFLSLAAIWLGWGIVSSLLHLVFTLVGGRGSNTTALNLVAWAGMPFALREVLRIFYLLITKHPIASPGLSGFVPAADGGGLLFLSALLALVDIFLIWHLVLLVIGSRRTENIPTTKALLVVISVITLVVVVQAGLSYFGGLLSGLIVTRPFYF